MVAGGLVEKSWTVLDGTHFFIRGGKIDPPDAREGNCGGAHGAGLKRDVEIAVDEAL